MTEAKSPVLPFLWYAPAYAVAPDHPTDGRSRVSHTVFVPVCIFVEKQQSQYMFLSMLCTPNTWIFLWLLSDVLDHK